MLSDVFPTVAASLEDICGFTLLTKLEIGGKIDGAVELSHNISALTNLKILDLRLVNVKTLTARMAYSLNQLQEFSLFDMKRL